MEIQYSEGAKGYRCCCCWLQQSPGLKGHQLLCRQSVTYIYSHVYPLMSPKYDHRNKSFPFCNYKLFHMIQSWILANDVSSKHETSLPFWKRKIWLQKMPLSQQGSLSLNCSKSTNVFQLSGLISIFLLLRQLTAETAKYAQTNSYTYLILLAGNTLGFLFEKLLLSNFSMWNTFIFFGVFVLLHKCCAYLDFQFLFCLKICLRQQRHSWCFGPGCHLVESQGKTLCPLNVTKISSN